MILRYRRRHFRIWMALAILLPIAFVVAWYSIPDSLDPPFSDPADLQLEYNFKGTTGHIQFNIKDPISNTGALVLVGKNSDSAIEDCIIVGQIQGAGSYKFTTDEDVSGSFALLYNPFTRKVINSFEL